MPDDDYEGVIVGYECYDIPRPPDRLWLNSADNNKLKNARQIKHLLKEMSADIPELQHGVKVEYVLSNIYKILKLMNDME